MMTTTKDRVRITVTIPRESYENMKEKAKAADISVNKMLNRAGSIVTTQQLVEFPLSAEGAAVPK